MAAMSNFRKPRIPYDEVESEFIRDEIAARDFDNPDDREYVHRLIRIEFLIRRVRDPIEGYNARGLWYGYPWPELDSSEADQIKEEIAPGLDIEQKYENDVKQPETDTSDRDEEQNDYREKWRSVSQGIP